MKKSRIHKKLRSCFELFEMFFEVKNLQTNNSKQLLNFVSDL